MPNFAEYNGQIIEPKHIYKFNIDKQSEFKCYTCDGKLSFRQSTRNGDKDYMEHFFHPNTKKGTHIECEKPLNEIKNRNSEWHDTLSSRIKQNNREKVRKKESGGKHIVDAFDPILNRGIEFQHSQISVEDIESRDSTTNLDWIFDVTKQYIRKINIGKYAICEIPHDNWEKAVKKCKNDVFLYTKYKEWLWFKTSRSHFRIEVEGVTRNVWVCRVITFEELLEKTCLKNIITPEGFLYFKTKELDIECSEIAYARCKRSMKFLDNVHRKYINKHKFKKNEILAIKSVAGSGKTTTLLNLAKTHSSKKILYIAFNKSLIEDIKIKISEQNINNLVPKTFDSLMREVFVYKQKVHPNIINLRVQTISDVIPWFNGKPWKVKSAYVSYFNKFCKQLEFDDIKKFSKRGLSPGKARPLLNSMWDKILNNEFFTFDSIRKIVQINHWCKDYIDNKYHMIFIDEAQDFDEIMLELLLNDTTIPKVFVGDPLQAIYQWRGCINAFDKLPDSSLIIEFYSTFRIGNPACEEIRKKFDNCWMISRNENETIIKNETLESNYVYLFRTWRCLLETAQDTENVWINNYDNQIEYIKKLHKKLQISDLTKEEKDGFSDDLPGFLINLTFGDLTMLINQIDENLVSKEESSCQMYTIHSYKGLENDTIRIYNDINIQEEQNLYYVALTRGMKEIILDKNEEPMDL
jgi:hypothetical protein